MQQIQLKFSKSQNVNEPQTALSISYFPVFSDSTLEENEEIRDQ